MKPAPEGLPRRLRNLRQSMDWSMTTVGKRTGFSLTSICRWESGDSALPVDGLLAYCKVFGLSPNELLEWKAQK